MSCVNREHPRKQTKQYPALFLNQPKSAKKTRKSIAVSKKSLILKILCTKQAVNRKSPDNQPNDDGELGSPKSLKRSMTMTPNKLLLVKPAIKKALPSKRANKLNLIPEGKQRLVDTSEDSFSNSSCEAKPKRSPDLIKKLLNRDHDIFHAYCSQKIISSKRMMDFDQ
eukprot:CAMPEP_0168324348 /NCGR_PEP_ID=MMETSP0213-20121227/4031_1 /TAXON_ID=151035 /ORGANISM="Euplotes harpa, Strain FSP1.4" /LENGTH=167 /DNA_ID=CAMNT_0008326609 /DNA_START=527 /DNA_END=1030 /DNA_ORIENTATION=-